MADRGVAKFQIGKNGVTDGVIDSLNLIFKTHKTVRISVLKSSISTREKIKEFAGEICEKLVGKYRFNVIGFTIVMKRVGHRP